jgi:hypothetical protein
MSAIPQLPNSVSFDASAALPLIHPGDIGAEVAALAVENGQTERNSDHEQRRLDEAGQQTADDQQVQAIHEEASSLRTQALVDGAIGVGTAVVDAGIGIYAAQAASAASATSRYTTGNAISTALSTGLSKVTDGLFGAAQKDDEANAAADKASADRYASDAQDASQDATDAESFVNSALDFVRGYEATVAQTQAAALHRA